MAPDVVQGNRVTRVVHGWYGSRKGVLGKSRRSPVIHGYTGTGLVRRYRGAGVLHGFKISTDVHGCRSSTGGHG
jgi:hypothetical protein